MPKNILIGRRRTDCDFKSLGPHTVPALVWQNRSCRYCEAKDNLFTGAPCAGPLPRRADFSGDN